MRFRPLTHAVAACALCGLIWVTGAGYAQVLRAQRTATPGPDPSFGGGKGWVLTQPTAGTLQGRAGVVDDQGRIVVAGMLSNGNAATQLAIARYTPSGALDATFSGDGLYVPSASVFGGQATSANGVAIQDDGKIVAAGGIGSASTGPVSKPVIVRLGPQGRLDQTFGGADNGYVALDVGDPNLAGYANALTIQPTGKIIVAGFAQNGTTGDQPTLLARVDSRGRLDNGFGQGGIVLTTWGAAADVGPDFSTVITTPGGRIIAAGRNDLIGGKGPYKSQGITAIARYLSNGTLDPSYGTGGKAIISRAPMFDWFSCTARLDQSVRLVAPGVGSNVDTIRLTARWSARPDLLRRRLRGDEGRLRRCDTLRRPGEHRPEHPGRGQHAARRADEQRSCGHQAWPERADERGWPGWRGGAIPGRRSAVWQGGLDRLWRARGLGGHLRRPLHPVLAPRTLRDDSGSAAVTGTAKFDALISSTCGVAVAARATLSSEAPVSTTRLPTTRFAPAQSAS